MAIPAILVMLAGAGTRATVKKYGKKAVDEALNSKQGQKFKKKIIKKYGPRPKADTKEGRQAIVKRTNKIKKDTIREVKKKVARKKARPKVQALVVGMAYDAKRKSKNKRKGDK